MYIDPYRYIIKVIHIGGIQYVGRDGASSTAMTLVTPMNRAQAEQIARRLHGVKSELVRVL